MSLTSPSWQGFWILRIFNCCCIWYAFDILFCECEQGWCGSGVRRELRITSGMQTNGSRHLPTDGRIATAVTIKLLDGRRGVGTSRALGFRQSWWGSRENWRAAYLASITARTTNTAFWDIGVSANVWVRDCRFLNITRSFELLGDQFCAIHSSWIERASDW